MVVTFFLPCVWCTHRHKCGNALEMAGSTEKTRITLPYDCPVPPAAKHLYTDYFARTRALPFIAAANSRNMKELKECLKTHFYNIRILEQIKVPCDSTLNECMVYVAYNPTDSAIVIAFRSTNSAAQLLVEVVDFMLQTQNDFQPVGGSFGFVLLLYITIMDFFYVFGHSLGGSLASLAAAWISRMGIVHQDQLKFVSFGQPRTGNTEFARAFDSLVPFKYRVIHKHDSVTQMPVRLPFTTFTFIHHRYEVYYKNDMEPKSKCTICLRAEDPNCSLGTSDPPDPLIHRNYFNVTLSEWPKSSCRLPADLYELYRGSKPWTRLLKGPV
ncbi:Lipase, class 3 family-containing protein [Aphelenchoides besseyi]|nr:Lipase, class 3 family-containing protein [Aphelenchoides besseyi]